MIRGARLGTLLSAWAVLLIFGWLSWQVYASHRGAGRYEGPWTIGPPAGSLNQTAERHLSASLVSLRGLDRPIDERLSSYRQELRAAEDLLEKSLRVRPPQAQTLARLAATRWELAQPSTEPVVKQHLAMIEVASKMAPGVPGVQFELGKLLLQMGRTDDAGRAFTRTLALDPGRSADVVGLLQQRGVSSDEILRRIPRRAEVLVALARAFRAEGRVDAYRALLERELDPEHPDSVAAFGAACLATDHAGRLVERLDGLGTRASAEAEVQRLQQLSLGYLALSRPAEALESARSARKLFPQSGAGAEHLGDVAHRAQDSEASRAAYREALALWAREPGKPVRRARLYLKIGRTHETDGRADLAYDAFKKALRLNENERYARRRVAEMEAAAGGGGRPGGSGG